MDLVRSTSNGAAHAAAVDVLVASRIVASEQHVIDCEIVPANCATSAIRIRADQSQHVTEESMVSGAMGAAGSAAVGTVHAKVFRIGGCAVIALRIVFGTTHRAGTYSARHWA